MYIIYINIYKYRVTGSSVLWNNAMESTTIYIYGGGNSAMVHSTRRFIVDSVDVNGDFGPPKITERHWGGRLLGGTVGQRLRGGDRCLKHWGATPEDCVSASDDQQPAPGGKAGGKVTMGPAQTGLGGL